MNGKLYFFGVTRGLTAWPIPPEQRYFDRFYQSDKTKSSGKTEFIILRDVNGRVSYNWLQYGNIRNYGDRSGSFFGMSFVLDGAYCYDVVGLRQHFSRIFNEHVKGNHAVFIPSADSPSSVRFAVQSMENLNSVIEEVERVHFSDLSAFDVRTVDSSFKSNCDQGVRMEVGNNNDDALDALRNSCCVAIPTSGNKTDRKEIISKFNAMLLSEYYQALDYIRVELNRLFNEDDYDSAKNLLKIVQNARIKINALRLCYEREQVISDLDSDFMSVEKQLSKFIDSRWASLRDKYNLLLKRHSDLIVSKYDDAQAHKLLFDVNSMVSELGSLCKSYNNDNTVQQLYKDIIGLRTKLNDYIKPKPTFNPKYLYIGVSAIVLIALVLIFKPFGDNRQSDNSVAELIVPVDNPDNPVKPGEGADTTNVDNPVKNLGSRSIAEKLDKVGGESDSIPIPSPGPIHVDTGVKAGTDVKLDVANWRYENKKSYVWQKNDNGQYIPMKITARYPSGDKTPLKDSGRYKVKAFVEIEGGVHDVPINYIEKNIFTIQYDAVIDGEVIKVKVFDNDKQVGIVKIPCKMTS